MSDNSPIEVARMAIDDALHEHYRQFGRVPTAWVLIVEHSDGQSRHIGIECSDETSIWQRVGMLHAAQTISTVEIQSGVMSIEEGDEDGE